MNEIGPNGRIASTQPLSVTRCPSCVSSRKSPHVCDRNDELAARLQRTAAVARCKRSACLASLHKRDHARVSDGSIDSEVAYESTDLRSIIVADDLLGAWTMKSK